MKKTYKHKVYTCQKYQIEFPVKANPKIEPHKGKNFDDVEITSKDTIEKEIVNIELIRIKHSNEANRPPQ